MTCATAAQQVLKDRNFAELVTVPETLQEDIAKLTLKIRMHWEFFLMVGSVKVKPRISFPATGCQKLMEVDDECKQTSFSL